MSVALQLHATEDDVDEILAELAPTCEFAHSVRNRGYLRYCTTDGPIAARPDIGFIWCSRYPLVGLDGNDLSATNPGALSIEVPRVRNGGIGEVMFGALIRDELYADRVADWQRFLRRYRKRLQSGATITNTRLGVSEYYRNAHATARAIDASRAGVRLVGVGPVNVYDYGPPREGSFDRTKRRVIPQGG